MISRATEVVEAGSTAVVDSVEVVCDAVVEVEGAASVASVVDTDDEMVLSPEPSSSSSCVEVSHTIPVNPVKHAHRYGISASINTNPEPDPSVSEGMSVPFDCTTQTPPFKQGESAQTSWCSVVIEVPVVSAVIVTGVGGRVVPSGIGPTTATSHAIPVKLTRHSQISFLVHTPPFWHTVLPQTLSSDTVTIMVVVATETTGDVALSPPVVDGGVVTTGAFEDVAVNVVAAVVRVGGNLVVLGSMVGSTSVEVGSSVGSTTYEAMHASISAFQRQFNSDTSVHCSLVLKFVHPMAVVAEPEILSDVSSSTSAHMVGQMPLTNEPTNPFWHKSTVNAEPQAESSAFDIGVDATVVVASKVTVLATAELIAVNTKIARETTGTGAAAWTSRQLLGAARGDVVATGARAGGIVGCGSSPRFSCCILMRSQSNRIAQTVVNGVLVRVHWQCDDIAMRLRCEQVQACND